MVERGFSLYIQRTSAKPKAHPFLAQSMARSRDAFDGGIGSKGDPCAEARLRVATARAPRKESPPDRFLRAPLFEAGSVSLDPGRARVSTGSMSVEMSVGHLDDGITGKLDGSHRALCPSRGREDAGHECSPLSMAYQALWPSRGREDAGHECSPLSMAYQAVAAAQEARARGVKRSAGSRIEGRGPTFSSSSPTVRRSRSARTSSTSPLRLSSSMPTSPASSLTTKPSMRGALLPAPRRATRKTEYTQKQVSVLFLSRAARNLEDLDDNCAAPEGMREVALARQWGLALVVSQWVFVVLLVMDRIFCLQDHLPSRHGLQ
jgi:hypothetical protein